MSQTVDTNILVYASNEDSPFHPRARTLVDHLATGPGVCVLLWPTVLGYLRIATHPAIFPSPLSFEDALGNMASFLGRDHVRAVGEEPEFWAVFTDVATEVKPRGNLVPDTHVVALMRQHGISAIWSRDRDFRKFTGITVRDPFDDRFADGFDAAG